MARKKRKPRKADQNPEECTTGYEGPEPCFGEYRCPTCKRMWMSANSWTSYGQRCRRCKTLVMAHFQEELIKSEDRNKCDKKKPHLQHLCGKCSALGRSCRRTRL